MIRNRPFIYQFFTVLAFFFTGSLISGQDEEKEVITVNKEYKLPDPTYYEGFYDIKIGMYYVYPKIGELIVGNPFVMTPEEYQKFMLAQAAKAYYKDKSDAYSSLFRRDKTEADRRGLIQTLNIRNKIFETIFGGSTIEIIPNGFASFDLGGLYQKIDNPLILPQNRTSFAFDIEQRIQLGLLGKVGENLTLKANYDTQSGFAFENKMNLI